MRALLAIPAKLVCRLHTTLASLAFIVALAAGLLSGVWRDLCANSVARWPVEWFPSVSATIGDHPATRAPFHILIALCATPRFLLLVLQWLAHRSRSASQMADLELIIGLARTFSCGCWMYITSRDSPALHDLFMILYLVLTLPWMVLTTASSSTPELRRRRQYLMAAFLFTMPPLIWQYYRHSVVRIPGAYTYYAFFEWSLVIWDIAFDSTAAGDLANIQISFIDSNSTDTEEKPFRPRLSEEDDLDWSNVGTATEARSVGAYLGDLVFGIVFWTVFTSLPFQLFYWSVWELALAGSELALLANLSPLLLYHRTVRVWVRSKSGLIWTRFVTVIFGMGCYAAPLPILRLLGVFIGTGAGWLSILNPLFRIKGSQEAATEAQVLLTSLTCTVLLKYTNASINPFWASADEASGGWNKMGLLIASLSLWEVSRRPSTLFAGSPVVVKDKVRGPEPFSYRVAIGFGALIHLLHTFATDSGTIIAWTWSGYPITGPTLHPFAGVMIAAMSLSTIVPLSRHLAAGLIGVGSIALLHFPDWTGYIAGLVVVFGLLGSFPGYVRAVSALPLASTLGIAMAFYATLDVLSVVTVAYAFVPLGHLLRERTDIVLGVCSIAIFAGISDPRPTQTSEHSHRRARSIERYTRCASIVLSALALLYGTWKMPSGAPVPYSKFQIFSGGIWTVHFGVDAAGRDSQHRMKELLRDMEVDVVGLLESDLHRMVYGNRDLTRVIAEELGYYVDLGPGPNHHTWGAALLSKFPILNSTHHLLPSPNGELAPAIHATLDVFGERVNVLVSHNGQEEDPLDRELQTTEIARLLRETADTPTVFLGYLVTKPGAKRPAPYQILMEDGLINDIEKEDSWRWCEYIAFRGLWRIAYARVHESDITDTELQVGKFLLPLPGTKANYENDEQMYWHIGEMDIPEPWRMPQMFRDEGVRGHRYTTWIGPVYYMPPEHSGMQTYGR